MQSKERKKREVEESGQGRGEMRVETSMKGE
jgi:hypothetical protein